MCVRELTKNLETPFTNISIGPPFYSMPVTQPWRLWVTKSHKPAKNDEITTKKHSETKPFACYIIYILPVSCMQSNQCAARNSSVMFANRDKWHCSAHRHTCRLTTYSVQMWNKAVIGLSYVPPTIMFIRWKYNCLCCKIGSHFSLGHAIIWIKSSLLFSAYLKNKNILHHYCFWSIFVRHKNHIIFIDA